MIQVLYTQDHADRGIAFASEIGASHNLIDVVPAAKGITTLTLWGHGDNHHFCGKDASEIKKVIVGWKKVNPQLSTVEIITCNARHAPSGSSSFVNQLKNKLQAFFSSTHKLTKKIAIKALPVSVGGKSNAFSILLADHTSKSWCYITAPGTDDSLMWQGANKIKFHDVDGKSVSYKGNIAERANQIASNDKDRKYTLNYGSFSMLRKSLVFV